MLEVSIKNAECKMQSYFHFLVSILAHMEIPTYFELSGKIPLNFKQNT